MILSRVAFVWFCAVVPIWCGLATAADAVLVEAESFAGRGGWVIDTQSIDQMGSPYLHDLRGAGTARQGGQL